ncbi:MAG: hypothetical protein KGI68_11670 [Alphaproteobacteria bacterium]|nr:hypothetical protein [Alphaproteobacteria bacterium]
MTRASARLSARMRAAAASLSLGMLMVLGGASDVHAQDTRTLAKFLSSCNSDRNGCRDNLHDYTLAASRQGMICMPKDLSINEAVGQELDWLRNVGAQKDEINNGNAEDAEWTAISTLWPCASDATTETAAR